MGKGDKKSRRGKIILGSFGVRRLRKKAYKPGIKQVKVSKVTDQEILQPAKIVKETKPAKEKTLTKVSKSPKEEKEVAQGVSKDVKQEPESPKTIKKEESKAKPKSKPKEEKQS